MRSSLAGHTATPSRTYTTCMRLQGLWWLSQTGAGVSDVPAA